MISYCDRSAAAVVRLRLFVRLFLFEYNLLAVAAAVAVVADHSGTVRGGVLHPLNSGIDGGPFAE